MRLKSLEYSEHEGAPEEWTLRGFTPGNANLLVGKNASGKSSILNVIYSATQTIAGGRLPRNWNFSLIFDNGVQETKYEQKIRNNKVVVELFMVGNETKLNRGEEGKGEIYAEKEGKLIEFQTPENQLAVVTRRDTLQHPFFEPLHQWAASLYYYEFGSSLGKDRFAAFFPDDLSVNPKDPSQVVGVFRRGKKISAMPSSTR